MLMHAGPVARPPARVAATAVTPPSVTTVTTAAARVAARRAAPIPAAATAAHPRAWIAAQPLRRAAMAHLRLGMGLVRVVMAHLLEVHLAMASQHPSRCGEDGPNAALLEFQLSYYFHFFHLMDEAAVHGSGWVA